MGDENRVDRDVVPTSNPPIPLIRYALNRPAVAQRQPMVAQPFKAGLGGRCGGVDWTGGCWVTSGSGRPTNNLPSVVNQVRNAVVIGGLVGDR